MQRVAGLVTTAIVVGFVQIAIGANCGPVWSTGVPSLLLLLLGIGSASRLVRSWRFAVHLVVVITFALTLVANVALFGKNARDVHRWQGRCHDRG